MPQTNPMMPTSQSTPPVAPSSADPTTAGNIAASKPSSKKGEVTTMTSISSMSELRQRAPKVYNMMMQGIGMCICHEIAKQQAHLKKMMADARRDTG